MTSLNLEKYDTDRYEGQLKWYSKKATKNKRCYYVYQTIIVSLSGFITVAVALDMNDPHGIIWPKLSLIASSLVTVLAGLQKFFRFHENWVQYRTTSEQLKKERYYREFQCGNYAHSESTDKLFVERVESIISRENSFWIVEARKIQGHGNTSEDHSNEQ